MREDELSLRPASPEDEPFLGQVYAATRREEVAAWGWPPEQQGMFLRMQYQLRSRAYAASFPGAAQSVIEAAGQPIGSMIVDRAASGMRLVDIALLPEHRGRGIGARLLADLIAEARRLKTPLRLSVRRENRAAQLYARLGFVPTESSEVYIEMELRSHPGD